jgi:hypothetical protein
MSQQGMLFSQIAASVAQFVGSTAWPIWAYIEAGDGWVQPSIFKERSKVVDYVLGDHVRRGELSDAILDAWNAEAPGKRWAVMEMDIADGRFTTRLRYPGEVPADGAGSMDRSEAAIEARFGSKPVIYPD